MKSLRDYLVESAQYEAMFRDIINAIPPERQSVRAAVEQKVSTQIRNARMVLKKNDRIVWFLRLWRIGEFGDSGTSDRAIASLARRMDCSPDDVRQFGQMTTNSDFLMELGHYLSLPIPQITEYVFSHQSPPEVIRDFKAAEKTWQETVKDSFVPDPNDVKFIKFPNGLAWWWLKRRACEIEGKAMGHCGNVPSQKKGDRLLSLRQSIMVNGVEKVKPYLTFIRHRDGRLGEMKGRFNQSPKNAFEAGSSPSNFHDEIVALLRHEKITGIKGGGYAPEENFKLMDLDDHGEELLADKPELGGLSHMIAKYGTYSEEALNKAQDVLDEAGIAPATFEIVGKPEDEGNREIIVERFPNLMSFLRNNDDQTLIYLLDLYDEHFGEGAGTMTLDHTSVVRLIEALPDHAFAILCRRAGITNPPPSNNAAAFNRAVRQIALMPIVQNDVEQFMQKVGMQSALVDRINAYIDSNWRFKVSSCWLEVPKNGDNYDWEQECLLKIGAREFMEQVEGLEDGDDADGEYTDLNRLRYNSYNGGYGHWDDLADDGDLSSWRGEYSDNPLVDGRGDDLMFGSKKNPKLLLDDESSLDILAQDYAAYLDGSLRDTPEPGGTPRLFDSRMRSFINAIRG